MMRDAASLRALVDEVGALPDPSRNLLSDNERELIDFCRRLAEPLRTQLAALEAADALEPDAVEETAMALWQEDFRLRFGMSRRAPWSRVKPTDRKKWSALARVALASTPKAECDGWQPIETAPKDGTEILICGQSVGDPWQDVAGWLLGAWREVDGSEYAFHSVTHWHPLPTPPTAQKQE